MTRSPVAVLSGLCLAVLMSSCAGSGTGVDTAADAAAASAVEHSSAADGGGGSGGAASTAARPTGGNPGVPGGDRAGGGGGGGGGGAAQGNPGAPGDVAVFEEAGVPYSVLRDDATTRCAGGVCTLREPKVSAGNPDDVGGVGECLVKARSDIRYDPPAEGGFFRKGATVQATVDCTAGDAGTTSTDQTQTSDAGRSDGSASATATAVDQHPVGEPQG